MARFDIHFQALTEAEQLNTFKFVGWTYNPAIAVKGFQMLINQWLLCFLTPRGSDPTDLQRGTDFTKLIGSNLPLQDAQDVVNIAIDNCNDQVGAFQIDDNTLNPTERLASAAIVNFIENTSAPGFSVYIELKNQAGERLILNLPTAALTG
jgi:hypothetical protein